MRDATRVFSNAGRCSRRAAVLAGLFLALLTVPALSVPALSVPAADTEPTADWPQYRGPHRDGTLAARGDLAQAWPASGPPELWRHTIGSGFSTVAVAHGLAFVQSVDTSVADPESQQEVLVAYDARTGAERWRTALGTPTRSPFGDGPRTTPTIVGDRLYTVTSTAELLCLSATDGAVHWSKDLKQYGPPPRFGYSMSPLVTDGMVVVDVGTKDRVDAERARLEAERDAAGAASAADEAAGEDAGDGEGDEGASEPEPVEVPPQPGAVAAFDAATGELLWRGEVTGDSEYSSPIVAELGGVRQMVLSRRSQVLGMDFGGKILWRLETEPNASIVMPVLLGDDTIFVSASDDHFGGLALRVQKTEAADGTLTWSAEEAWSERLMRNHFNTSVRVGDVLYGFDNTTFKALDAATGRRHWVQRGFGKGSLVAAGDLLYVLGDDGILALVHATDRGYHETGRVQAMEGKAWTSPSLARGILYLRDHDEVVAYDVRREAVARAGAGNQSRPADDAPEGLSGDELAAARAAAESAAQLDADEIVRRHVAARGGAEAWAKVQSLELRGTYRAFSEISDFVLQRARGARPDDGDTLGDLYRLQYTVIGVPAIRASDGEGPWLQHAFLTPGPARTAAVPPLVGYGPQMVRESHFGPLLLDADALGLAIEIEGAGEILGRPTVDLEVTFPSSEGSEEEPAEPTTEIWHLDPQTFLEIAVDSQIIDLTQGPPRFRQRAFFDDFRKVGDIVLPHEVELEFNARFESMEVESATVNPDLASDAFTPPPPPAPPAAPEDGDSGDGGSEDG